MAVRAGEKQLTSRRWHPLAAACFVVFFGSLVLQSTGWVKAFAIGMLVIWASILVWSLWQTARGRIRERLGMADDRR